MAPDPRIAIVKKEVEESQLAPLPNGMALMAFSKSLIAERDGDAAGGSRWLTTALKYEAR